MSHRIGECSSCGAQYKLPATFSADRARCKQCDGVVEIGPPVDSEPVATPPEAAPPVPAEPRPVELKKKREGPSMKERLLAQRKEAEAAAAEPKPVPARKPAARSSVSRKSAPRREKRPENRGEKLTAKTGVRSSRSSAPAKSRRNRSRRHSDDDDDDQVEERGSRRQGHGAYHRRPKKSPVVPFFMALIAFAFASAGVWYMFFGPGATPEPTPDEVADAGQDPEGAGDLAPTEGDPEAATPEETTPDEGDPEETASEETDPEEETPKVAPKPIPGDPDSIDLTVFPEYGAIDGCSEDRFIELKQFAADMTDPMSGAAGNRARIKLEAAGKEAFPVIVNKMKKLNLFDEDDFSAGDLCQKTLQNICNGMNAGWWYPDVNPDDYVYKNKQAISLWCKTWERVKDDEEKWLILTKQKKRGDPAEKPKEEEAASDDELDELDDL